jgi:hypothetical protein
MSFGVHLCTSALNVENILLVMIMSMNMATGIALIVMVIVKKK